MTFTPIEFAKDGEANRFAYTASERTELVFSGWTAVGEGSPPVYELNPRLAEAIQDALQNFLAEGANVTLEYDDEEDRLVISATGGGGSSFDAEAARDAIMASISGAGLVNVAVDDVLDTIVITTAATANDTNANLRDRTTHTGEQPQSSITGLVTDLSNKQPLHAALTSIAGLTPANNQFLGYIGSAYSWRTAAQVKTTLSLDLVNNTSDATKPVSTAQQAAIDAAKARGVHTGTQPSSTISDLTEVVQDIVSGFIASGTGITWTVDDAGNTATIAATGGGGTWDAEQTRDSIGAALVGTGLIAVVPNDAGDSITITTTATANATDAALRDRGTHTGTQAASTISDLTEAVQDVVGAMFTDSAEVDVTYNDAGNVESIAITAIAISKVTGLQAALDSKLSNASRGFPSYAPTGLTGPYQASRCLFNAKGSNMQKARIGLTRALNGEKMHIFATGDSTIIGFNGSTFVGENAIPDRFGAILAASRGLELAGSGLVAAVPSPGYKQDGFVTTGTVDVTNYPGVIRMAAGSTGTYTFRQKGSSVNVFYLDTSAAFSFTVDGGTATNVTPSGTGTGTSKSTKSGLSEGYHTVVVTVPTNYVYLSFFEAVSTSGGIVVHNLALGGSQAGGTDPAKSWTHTGSAPYNVNSARRGAWIASGYTADLSIMVLGTNDISNGRTASATVADLATIKGWHGGDWLFAGAWNLRGITPEPEWANYLPARYQFAEDNNTIFIDWEAMFGNDDVTFAAGLAGTDGLHPDDGTEIEMAASMAVVFEASQLKRSDEIVPAAYLAANPTAPGLAPNTIFYTSP